MTTSEETTTDETPTRTLDELVNAGTYQGMTDDEIQRLIDYYVGLAESNASVAAIKESNAARVKSQEETNATQIANAKAFMDSVLNNMTAYQPVTLSECVTQETLVLRTVKTEVN